MLCSHNHHPELFSSSQTETPYLFINDSLVPPLLHTLATAILFSVSMNLTILGNLYKWITLFVLLWLVSFTYHNVFKVHPCYSMYQNFLPFKEWVIFHCMHTPHFVYTFIHHWTILATVNNAVQFFVWTRVFTSFGYISRNGITG